MTASDAAWRQLIPALQASGPKAALAITGGGSGAIGELLRVPGGSRLLIEAQVPYDQSALEDLIGFAPEQACSAETAIAMAQAIRARAARLMPAEPRLVGLGATAALVSDRPRRGEHRFHIATASAAGVAHGTVVLAKGRRDRAGEEDIVTGTIILFLARTCGVAGAPSPQTILDPDERYTETAAAPTDPIDRLLAGEISRLTVEPDGRMLVSAPSPAVLFPGSFNPMHEGHTLLARIAEEFRQAPVAFEISVTNVDKPPLAAETIRRRLAQFAWKAPVELTRAPTFVEKSRLFPGTTFVVGADTAERLFAAKYYGGEPQMHAALDEIVNARGHFLVAVRLDPTGQIRALADIAIPERYTRLFTEIPEHRFRVDTSSSEIRARRAMEP